GPTPEAGVERRRVDGGGIEWVETDVDHAERARAVAVPDLREGLAAVGRLVEARAVGARRETGRPPVADHVRESTHAQRGPDGVLCQIAVQPRPRGVGRESVVGAPDAAARDADPQAAGPR